MGARYDGMNNIGFSINTIITMSTNKCKFAPDIDIDLLMITVLTVLLCGVALLRPSPA